MEQRHSNFTNLLLKGINTFGCLTKEQLCLYTSNYMKTSESKVESSLHHLIKSQLIEADLKLTYACKNKFGYDQASIDKFWVLYEYAKSCNADFDPASLTDNMTTNAYPIDNMFLAPDGKLLRIMTVYSSADISKLAFYEENVRSHKKTKQSIDTIFVITGSEELLTEMFNIDYDYPIRYALVRYNDKKERKIEYFESK